MDRNSVVKQLKEYILNSVDVQSKKIDKNTDLFQEKILDSLQIVSLVMFIEDNFSITLAFDDLTEDNMRSLATITELIILKTK